VVSEIGAVPVPDVEQPERLPGGVPDEYGERRT